MKRLKYRFGAVLLLTILWGTATLAQARPPYKVFAYLPDYKKVDLAQLPWDDLTHVLEMSASPNADGTIRFPHRRREGLAEAAHAHGVRCLLCLGGAGDSITNWESAVGPQREAFIASLMKAVTLYGYDGVDIDWEFPEPADKAAFTDFMTGLSKALHATQGFDGRPRELSFCICALYYICGLDFPALGKVADEAVLMSYEPLEDDSETDTDCLGNPRHLSVKDGVEHVEKYGFPAGKLIMGMPLMDNSQNYIVKRVLTDGTYISYDPVRAEASYSYKDKTVQVDTAQSFKDKMHWAFSRPTPVAGIALWELTLAYPPTDSAVTALWSAIGGDKGPTSTPSKAP